MRDISRFISHWRISRCCSYNIHTTWNQHLVYKTEKIPDGSRKLHQTFRFNRLRRIHRTVNCLEFSGRCSFLKSQNFWPLSCSLSLLIFLLLSVGFYSNRKLIRFEYSKIVKLLIVIIIVPLACNCYMFFLFDTALKKKKVSGNERTADDITENFFENESESAVTDVNW